VQYDVRLRSTDDASKTGGTASVSVLHLANETSLLLALARLQAIHRGKVARKSFRAVRLA
jgi:hypothetical protein